MRFCWGRVDWMDKRPRVERGGDLTAGTPRLTSISSVGNDHKRRPTYMDGKSWFGDEAVWLAEKTQHKKRRKQAFYYLCVVYFVDVC